MKTLCESCANCMRIHDHTYTADGNEYTLTYVDCRSGESVWTWLAAKAGMECPGYEKRK
jgi:hypothetical protein